MLPPAPPNPSRWTAPLLGVLLAACSQGAGLEPASFLYGLEPARVLGARAQTADVDAVARRRLEVPLQTIRTVPELGGDVLRIKIAAPGRSVRSVLRRGLRQPAYLLVSPSDEATVALQLVPHTFHRLHRARWGLLAALALAVAGGGGYAAYRTRRDRAALQRRSRLQAVALDAMPEGVLALAPGGEVLFTNYAFRNALQGEDGDPLHAPALRTFVHDARTAVPAAARTAALRLGRNGCDGLWQVSARPVPFSDGGGPYWLVEARPPDGARPLQPGAWPMIVSELAHEFRRPATGLLLTVQQLQARYRQLAPAAAAQLDPYAESIIERIGYLRRLSSNYMKFAGQEALRPTPTDANAFLEETAAMLAPGLAADFALALRLDPSLPPVPLDGELMRSVFQNLVANAVNAMPEGGVITLASARAANVRRSAEAPACDYAVLEVRDTGVGIPPSNRARIFERGFSTTIGGAGLGLAIVRQAAEGHGGFVEVKSEPGMGTVFALHLPIAGAEA